MTAEVQINAVTHRFGTFTALDEVNLTIGAGEFAVLLGPSGCGKTTLLSILGGFLTPSEGAIVIGGEDITHLAPAKRPTTTMFQDYALFPHMSLGDNVGFGLRMRGLGRGERDAKAREMLELVGLEGDFDKRPHELSGGQRQRVALARALAVDPDVLLLDEPLGALDLKLRRQMQDELKAIQKRVGTTFIHVTHDQEEAMAIADDIIVMNEGQVQASGSPEAIYLKPANRFTVAFMGEANFISGVIAELTEESAVVTTAFGTHTLPRSVLIGDVMDKSAPVELCFRPEHVRQRSGVPDRIEFGAAQVVDTSFFGTHHRCHVAPEELGNGATFTAHLPQTMAISIGDDLALELDPANVIVLPANRSAERE